MKVETIILLSYGLIATAVAVATSLAAFRGGASKIQKDLIDALTLRVQLLKDENGDLRAQVASLTGKVDLMIGHEQFLQDLVRGIPDWAKLHQSVEGLEAHARRLEEITRNVTPEYQKKAMQHLDDTSAILALLEKP